MKIKKLQLAIMTASLAGAMSASASVKPATVSVTFDTVNPSETVNLASPFINSGNPVEANAGIYNLTVDGVATPSFCIDVADENNNNTFLDYYYNDLAFAPLAPAGPMGSSAATDIEKLWAAYYPAASGDNQTAAALQVAMWEDIAAKATTPYSITVNNNDPNDAIYSEAAGMIANLPNLTVQADLMGLVGPNGPNNEQSYVVAVPEPTTAGCFLLGLGALVCWQRLAQKRRS
jgi:hypothetical protein